MKDNPLPEYKANYSLDPSKCACRNWARILNTKTTPWTQHAPGCDFYSLERESLELVTNLLKCIHDLAEKDGIGPEFVDDYRRALMFTSNVKMFEEHPIKIRNPHCPENKI